MTPEKWKTARLLIAGCLCMLVRWLLPQPLQLILFAVGFIGIVLA